MKVVLSKKALSEALQKISSSIAKNPTMQILSSVKMSVNNGKASLRATNLESETVCPIDLESASTDRDFLLPFDIMSKVAKSATSSVININIEHEDSVGDKIQISSGKTNLNFSSPSAENFPEIVNNQEMQECCSLDNSVLLNLINNTSFSISKNTERYNLTGLYFKLNDSKLTTVSTDGHRLSIDSTAVESDQEIDFIVPAKPTQELKKMLKAKNSCQLLLDSERSKVQFQIEGVTFSSKLLDATFPDYERIIPQDNDKILEADTKNFLSALERVKIINDLKGKGVQMEIKSDAITFTAKADNGSQIKDEIECSFLSSNNEALTVTYNPEFLEEPLKAMQADKFRMVLSEENRPALINSLTSTSANYVIMPMRNEN